MSGDQSVSYPALEERIAELERRLAAAGSSTPVAPRRRRIGAVVAIVAAVILVPGLTLAGHQFADVPDDNLYHSDIAALTNSGVTTGCGGGNYCPGQSVTREQMAAFLNRLGALAPGSSPVVNADRLDGHHANELIRVSSQNTNVSSAVLTQSEIIYLTVSVEAPTAGWVLVNAALTIREQACLTNCTIAARLRHSQSGSNSIYHEAWVKERASMALMQVFFVTPGTNTFQTRIHRVAVGDGNVNGWYNQMSAIFMPFDGNGNPPPS